MLDGGVYVIGVNGGRLLVSVPLLLMLVLLRMWKGGTMLDGGVYVIGVNGGRLLVSVPLLLMLVLLPAGKGGLLVAIGIVEKRVPVWPATAPTKARRAKREVIVSTAMTATEQKRVLRNEREEREYPETTNR